MWMTAASLAGLRPRWASGSSRVTLTASISSLSYFPYTSGTLSSPHLRLCKLSHCIINIRLCIFLIVADLWHLRDPKHAPVDLFVPCFHHRIVPPLLILFTCIVPYMLQYLHHTLPGAPLRPSSTLIFPQSFLVYAVMPAMQTSLILVCSYS